MHVLLVFHAPPFPPDIGPSRRHYHVLSETMKRHDVTVLSLGTPSERIQLLEHTGVEPSRVHYVAGDRTTARKALRAAAYLTTARSHFRRLRIRRMQQAIDRVTRAARFDVAYFSTVMLGCYRLPRGIPLVGDTHNVEHDTLMRAAAAAPERWRRVYYGAQAVLTRREERRHLAKFDIVCATSPRDRSVLHALAPRIRIDVVPNGIDLEKYSPPPTSRREDGVLLFTGLMSYYPNQHAVLRFARNVLPLVRQRVPHARLIVAGADPSCAVRALAGEHVDITGRVADVRPYYARAHAVVVPLSIGGGTRVKVLEAMAMGVPVVSTALGCEGLDVVDGRSVLIGDSDAALADAVVRVLQSPTLAESLVTHGREVARQYGWGRIGQVLDAVMQTAASERAPFGRAPSAAGACRAY